MKSILSGLIGKRVRVTGGKKAPIGAEGTIVFIEHSGYNLMVTAESKSWDGKIVRVEMVDYNWELID